MSSVGTPMVWGVFALVVLVALAIDLGLFHRQARELGMREAGVWVGVWVLLAGAFNAFVFYRFGMAKGLEFSQGYLLELALSTDNLFVFILIFSYFRVPRAYQHRVLFWGIVGAVLTRGMFIAVGATVIHNFRWVLYFLGVLPALCGIQDCLPEGLRDGSFSQPGVALVSQAGPCCRGRGWPALHGATAGEAPGHALACRAHRH
jgi:TerC family integral membrane protein